MAKRNNKAPKAPTAPAPVVNDAPQAPSADMAIVDANGDIIPHTPSDDASLGDVIASIQADIAADDASAPQTDAPAVADTAPATVSDDAGPADKPGPQDLADGNVRRFRQTTIDAAKLAAQGNIPAPPDFTKPTHAGYRKRLAALVVAVDAGDIGPLLADKTQPVSSSRIMLCRYRDNALAALLARKAAADLAAQSAPATDGADTQAA